MNAEPPADAPREPCDECAGDGRCNGCLGTGWVAVFDRSELFEPMNDVCPDCDGDGKCPICEGKGETDR